MSSKSIKQTKRNFIFSKEGITLIKKESNRNAIYKNKIIKINLKEQNEYNKLIKNKVLFYILLYLLFFIFSVEWHQRKLQMEYSYIILKTKGKGLIRIFGNNGLLPNDMPYEVYINGIRAKEINFNTISIVQKMIWILLR